jgi:hypothetical protein
VALYIVNRIVWRCRIGERVGSCGVAGIVCRERVAFVRYRWNAGSCVVMRMGDSGLRSIIGIGDYLNISIVFPSLNNIVDLACFPAFSDTC